MDLPSAWCQHCVCGRTFSVPQAYSCHKRSCQKTKKRLSGALEKAKEAWQVKKRRKVEGKAQLAEGPSSTPNVVAEIASDDTVAADPEVDIEILVSVLITPLIMLARPPGLP
jgi:hypothetical protein